MCLCSQKQREGVTAMENVGSGDEQISNSASPYEGGTGLLGGRVSLGWWKENWRGVSHGHRVSWSLQSVQESWFMRCLGPCCLDLIWNVSSTKDIKYITRFQMTKCDIWDKGECNTGLAGTASQLWDHRQDPAQTTKGHWGRLVSS